MGQKLEHSQIKIPRTYLNQGALKAVKIAKEFSLNIEQQNLVAMAIAKRDFENNIKVKYLTTQEERDVIYRINSMEFVSMLKEKLPLSMINKINEWETKYKQ